MYTEEQLTVLRDKLIQRVAAYIDSLAIKSTDTPPTLEQLTNIQVSAVNSNVSLLIHGLFGEMFLQNDQQLEKITQIDSVYQTDQLRQLLGGHSNAQVLCQVVDQEGGAWNLDCKAVWTLKDRLVFALSHPQLKRLPYVNFSGEDTTDHTDTSIKIDKVISELEDVKRKLQSGS